jgi:hypothetical protein
VEKIKIWRDAKPLEVEYRLPRFEYTNSLVPYAVRDQEPEYLIVGGLIFEPLTDAYLQSWGADWKRTAPFRLNYYNHDEPTKARPSLVLLSQVLPDPYNIGYQDQKEALRQPLEGTHVIEFVPGDTVRRMVLGAGEAEGAATERVLSRYNIPAAARIR